MFTECPDPTPNFGSLISQTNFTYGETVEVYCDVGYDLIGTANITCGADGTWSNVPVCDPSGNV